MKIWLVGGFLGSGKTTAIHQAVLRLHQQNETVGVITNDQGTHQVDTAFIKYQDIPTQEVAGSCFCCNFDELEDRISCLVASHQPRIIFAESVGSCADLIATVLKPLLHFHSHQWQVVLSVFADVRLLCIFIQGDKNIFYNNVNYIYEKQIEEADILVITKIDLLNMDQLQLAKKLIVGAYGHKKILYQNSFSAEDVNKWVETATEFSVKGAHRPKLEIDYSRYGAGEAELAWLDEEINIYCIEKNAQEIADLFVQTCHRLIVQADHRVGHLKFLISDGQSVRKTSYAAMEDNPSGPATARPSTDQVKVLINARIQAEPGLLAIIIAGCIEEVKSVTGCSIQVKASANFKPGYPVPTHRL